MARDEAHFLERSQQMRVYVPAIIESALQLYATKHNLKKSEALVKLISGGDSLDKEIEETKRFYDYER